MDVTRRLVVTPHVKLAQSVLLRSKANAAPVLLIQFVLLPICAPILFVTREPVYAALRQNLTHQILTSVTIGCVIDRLAYLLTPTILALLLLILVSTATVELLMAHVDLVSFTGTMKTQVHLIQTTGHLLVGQHALTIVSSTTHARP
jgi:F0F1-type ATP synthase assembly protein I